MQPHDSVMNLLSDQERDLLYAEVYNKNPEMFEYVGGMVNTLIETGRIDEEEGGLFVDDFIESGGELAPSVLDVIDSIDDADVEADPEAYADLLASSVRFGVHALDMAEPLFDRKRDGRKVRKVRRLRREQQDEGGVTPRKKMRRKKVGRRRARRLDDDGIDEGQRGRRGRRRFLGRVRVEEAVPWLLDRGLRIADGVDMGDSALNIITDVLAAGVPEEDAYLLLSEDDLYQNENDGGIEVGAFSYGDALVDGDPRLLNNPLLLIDSDGYTTTA